MATVAEPLIARDETEDRTRGADRSAAVDGLRGVAALIVALAHTGFIASGGYAPRTDGAIPVIQSLTGAGVLLFFSLSGYLIAGPWLRALVAGTPFPSVGTYFVRRFARILPAYWVALVAVFVVGMTAWSALQWWQVPVHGLLLQSSWPVVGEATALYFVAWTLGIELAFYVVVPLGALLLRRLHPGPWPVARLALVVLAAAAVTLAWGLWFHWHPPAGRKGALALNGLQNWLFAFAPGMLVALAALAPLDAPWVRAYRSAVARRAPVLAVVAGLWALAYLVGRSDRPALNFADQPIYVLASGLLVATVLAGPSRGLGALRALAPVGLVSYGVYLWHSLVVDVIVRHPSLGVQGGLLAYAVDLVIVLAITLPLAAASWLGLERPLIRRAASWASARRSPTRVGATADQGLPRPLAEAR